MRGRIYAAENKDKVNLAYAADQALGPAGASRGWDTFAAYLPYPSR
jgi:hypothetical protein